MNRNAAGRNTRAEPIIDSLGFSTLSLWKRVRVRAYGGSVFYFLVSKAELSSAVEEFFPTFTIVELRSLTPALSQGERGTELLFLGKDSYAPALP